MKKACYIIAAVLTAAALLSSCQATPEQPVVVQKDMQQMIEKAQASPSAQATQAAAEHTLAKRLSVPERFTQDDGCSNERFTLKCDAPVVLPDVDQLPMVRVEPADFSQEQVSKFYDYLIGGTPMYQEQRTYTKAQVEQSLVEWHRTLNDPNSAEDAKQQAEQEIKNLEAQYAAAPSSPALIPADATIKQQNDVDFTTGETHSIYSGVDIAEHPGLNVNTGKKFSVRNNTKDGEVIVKENIGGWTVTDTASQGARFTYTDFDMLADTNYMAEVETVTLDSLTDRPEKVGGLSYERALSITQDFLTAAGIEDMEVGSMTLIYMLPDTFKNANDMSPPEFITYQENLQKDILNGKYDDDVLGVQVKLSLVRSVDGVTVTSDGSSSYTGDAMFGPQWFYESFDIIVCDEDIYSINWISPHSITETVTKDVTLLSFDKIADVLLNMYRVMYEAQYANASVSGVVTRVTLTLGRVMDQNNLGYGLFVPVWDFYGTLTVSYPDYPQQPPHDWLSDEPFMTINAIDGSVIDISKGY